jgi:Tetratricopeptide repeat
LNGAKKQQRSCIEKRRTFTFAGRKVILKEVADTVIYWLDRFKDVGDIAASVDHVHAGLPWAVSIPLTASTNRFLKILASMHSLAIHYSEAGRRAEALQLTEEVVELHKSKLGADHPDTLTSMHNLAIRYSEAGRRAEPLQLTEEVVELRKSKLGADHPDTLASERLLANLSQRDR